MPASALLRPFRAALFSVVLILAGSSCGKTVPTSPSPTGLSFTPSAAEILAPQPFIGRFDAPALGPDANLPAGAPGAPAGLAASVAGNVVTLTWTAPVSGDPPTSYVIEAGSAPGLANLAVIVIGAAPTFAGIAPNGTYYVRVKGRNASGTGPASNEIVVVVGGGGGCTSPPSAPTNLGATTGGFSVTLAWTAPASGCAPTSYIIEAGSTPGASNLANVDTGSTATSFGATAGPGTYYVRVRARNAFGVSGPSNEFTLIVGGGPCTPPAAPTGLAASVSGSTVTFTWNAVSGATSYLIEAGSSPGGSNALSTTSTSTSFVWTTGAGTYYARVKARNVCGATSAASAEIMVIVAETTGPGAPSNPSPADGAADVPTTPVTLSWTAGANTTGFDVYFGADCGSGDKTQCATLVSSNQSGTSYPLSQLGTSTLYYWYVTARGQGGASTRGPLWRFTTAASPAIRAVIDVPPTGHQNDRSVFFDGRRSTSPFGINRWTWEFGDGSSLVGNLPQVSHRYPCDLKPEGSNQRNFTVRLTIRDNNNNQATTTATITVSFTYPAFPNCGPSVTSLARAWRR